MRSIQVPLWFSLATFAATTCGQSTSGASAPPSSSTTYRDDAHGVTLRYGPAWHPDSGNSFYLGSTVSEAAPLLQMHWEPDARRFADTVFDGLSFTFATEPGQSLAVCGKLASEDGIPADPNPHRLHVNGTTFLRVHTGDAAMSHDEDAEVWTTFRQGTCLFFEGAVHTLAFGVKDNTRSLTEPEQRSLRTAIAQVMRTIRVSE